jgi:chemosensory pili system protein ChpA (sensor histidine kinase/response regulator)
MNTGTEHFALEWVSQEITATLEQAHVALEQYASGGDDTQLRSCLTHLHQIHGTLTMIEMPGTATLADHLEQLAQAMLAGQIEGNNELACQALMQGILELPAYVEQVREGGPDSAEPMLGLVNEIRQMLSLEPKQSDGDYQVEVGEDVLAAFDAIDGVEKSRKIRAAYQQLLLTLLKGERSDKTMEILVKVANGLTRGRCL